MSDPDVPSSSSSPLTIADLFSALTAFKTELHNDIQSQALATNLSFQEFTQAVDRRLAAFPVPPSPPISPIHSPHPRPEPVRPPLPIRPPPYIPQPRPVLDPLVPPYRPPVDHPSPPSFKMTVPTFDGSDPSGWIFRAEQFFNYHNTPAETRLLIVAFHMDGPAAAWFQWMQSNNLISTWSAFLRSVQQRFGPSLYEDPQGVLSKLSQTGSVADFQSAFEDLMNRVHGISEGLLTIRAGRPPPLALHAPPSSSAPASPADSPVPVRRLSKAELKERRDKGLCYTCEQRWSSSHKCPSRFLALVGAEDDDDTLPACDENDDDDDVVTADAPVGDISSLHSLTAAGRPRSLHLTATINELSFPTLVDNGSTHNFLHPTVVQQLRLHTVSITAFKVLVGNGAHLVCKLMCPQVPITMQGVLFHIDFQVLEIEGPSVVLGIQWLQTLGPVTHDYAAQSMEFMWEGRHVKLTGETPASASVISYSQLQALASSDEVA